MVGYAWEVEEWLLSRVCEGDDAAFGDLVQDGGTCGVICQLSGLRRWFLSIFDRTTYLNSGITIAPRASVGCVISAA